VVLMGADDYESDEARRAATVPLVGVGKGCDIRGAIIDKNARIGDGVRLSPDGKTDGTYAHGIIIRDGVLIVPKGAVIPAGTLV